MLERNAGSAATRQQSQQCTKMWQMLSMLYVCVRQIYTTQLSLSFSIKSACIFYSRVRPTKSTFDGDTMTPTPTQHAILDWLERNGPANVNAIARAHGMSRKTATGHLGFLSRMGLAHATGRGPVSRWRLGERLEASDGLPETSSLYDVQPIKQCPSVWVYAARVAAQAAQRG